MSANADVLQVCTLLKNGKQWKKDLSYHNNAQGELAALIMYIIYDVLYFTTQALDPTSRIGAIGLELV